jgi:hypothetical protein
MLLKSFPQGMVPALQMYSGSKEDNNDGEWLSVEPFPNSLVVNIGDMTQVLNTCINIETKLSNCSSVSFYCSLCIFHNVGV